MKKLILTLILPLLGTFVFGQDKQKADNIVSEGVQLHDKGSYEQALSQYDKALEVDKNNFYALSEKAYTLLVIEKYSEAIKYCQKAIEFHPEEKELKNVYVTYGNALDGLHKPDLAIKMYEDGIEKFPDFYMLHFNAAITYSGQKKYDEALVYLKKAVSINPKHASSHNAIAIILNVKNKSIPSFLASLRFLALEPESNRSKIHLASIEKTLNGGAEKSGKNSINININADIFADTLSDGSHNEYNFSTSEMVLMLNSALDFDQVNKKETDSQGFERKMNSLCASLAETKEKTGFYWEYYVPYFLEMNDKKLFETFYYIIQSTSGNKKVNKWIKKNQDKVLQFYIWSNAYNWTDKYK
ncbi:MAG: tetratricopeptide repeat protein [Flavobacteriia bacterium]|nr:tetratricopeptide repeat protein [Flavobacteriia bacterium]